MTLPASGQITLANVDAEIGWAAGSAIDLNWVRSNTKGGNADLNSIHGFAWYQNNNQGNCNNGNCATACSNALSGNNCTPLQCGNCSLTPINCANCDSRAWLQPNCNCACTYNCSQVANVAYNCNCACNCYSDERIKANWKPLDGVVEKLARVKFGTYDRTDIEQREVGVSAQDIEGVIPHVVGRDWRGLRQVDYARAALVAAVALAKEVESLRAELRALRGGE